MPTHQSSTVSRIEPAKIRQHASSRRSRSSYRYEARVQRYKMYLAGVTLLLLISLFFMWLNSGNDSSEYHQTIIKLRKQEAVSKNLAAELEKVKGERDILVQQRIPGLIPLRYDEAINIDNQYVRNIIFTLAKSGKKNIYEYRIVLHNNTLTVARPKAEIILFNDIGIQIGMAKIEQTDARDLGYESLAQPPILNCGSSRQRAAGMGTNRGKIERQRGGADHGRPPRNPASGCTRQIAAELA